MTVVCSLRFGGRLGYLAHRRGAGVLMVQQFTPCPTSESICSTSQPTIDLDHFRACPHLGLRLRRTPSASKSSITVAPLPESAANRAFFTSTSLPDASDDTFLRSRASAGSYLWQQFFDLPFLSSCIAPSWIRLCGLWTM